jgi:hypothetical protein
MKKQCQTGGVVSSNPKAPDKKGAFIEVQKRNLGNMKCGGKVKKGKK